MWAYGRVGVCAFFTPRLRRQPLILISYTQPQFSPAMQRKTAHRYVVTDEEILSGEPILEGTRTPVRAVVELWRTGVSPEEIPNRLPHLSLAQVFDALSYYSDHREAIHEYIEQNRIREDEVHESVRNADNPPDG